MAAAAQQSGAVPFVPLRSGVSLPPTALARVTSGGLSAAERKKALKAERKKARKAQKRAREPGAGDGPDPQQRGPTARRASGEGGGERSGGSWSGQVSLAFEGARWSEALELLEQGRRESKAPKLGALQRWVAALGDGVTTQPRSLRLLDALLRVADGLGVALRAPSGPVGRGGSDGGVRMRAVKLTKPADGSGYGLKLDPAGTLIVVRGVASAAGLLVGSRIVRVDGQPVNGKEEILAMVARHLSAAPIELTLTEPPPSSAQDAGGVLKNLPVWAATALRFETDPPSGTSKQSIVSVPRVLTSVHTPTEGSAVYDDVKPAAAYKADLNVLAHVAGAERTPPNLFDLSIYINSPGSLALAAKPPETQRHDVPFVPGAFVLSDVLFPHECRMILAASEAAGYVPDQPANVGRELAAATEAGLGGRAANFTLFAEDALLAALYERVKGLLPPEIGGGELAGLNARWRFYRYLPGAVYRPHIDGAWPASGLRPHRGGEGHKEQKQVPEQMEEKEEGVVRDGSGNRVEYVYDASGDRRSRLTFLLYLNEDFTGGCTTFFNASPAEVGVVEARGVAPRCGSVLCFPHGEGAGSRVHEGSAVTEGAKYIVRTDVLYKLPPKQGRQRPK